MNDRAAAHPLARARGARPAARAVGLLAGLLAALALSACAPTAEEIDDGRPDVALIDGPVEARVPGLADELAVALERAASAVGYDLADRDPYRSAELRSALQGTNAPEGAARLGRVFDAELVLVIGAPVFERDTDELGADLLVSGRVEIEVLVVRPEDGAVRGRLPSGEYRGERVQPAEVELPPLIEDPLLLDLALEALDALEPSVVEYVERVLVEEGLL